MKKDNVIRLKRVIESDRLAVTEECLELIIKDVTGVLSDYFRLCEKPEIKITSGGDGYTVTITAKADVLKTFAAVPF